MSDEFKLPVPPKGWAEPDRWSEPGADPLADLERWAATRPVLQPNRLIMGVNAYVAVIMMGMDFGPWPLRPIRRWLTRRRLRREILAEAESLD